MNELLNSCKRGEVEWTVSELTQDDEPDLENYQGPRYFVEEWYWVAGESTLEQDAYGAQPIAEFYDEREANLVSAAPDMRDFIREAYERGLLSELEQYQRAKAILEKAGIPL